MRYFWFSIVPWGCSFFLKFFKYFLRLMVWGRELRGLTRKYVMSVLDQSGLIWVDFGVRFEQNCNFSHLDHSSWDKGRKIKNSSSKGDSSNRKVIPKIKFDTEEAHFISNFSIFFHVLLLWEGGGGWRVQLGNAFLVSFRPNGTVIRTNPVCFIYELEPPLDCKK